MLAKRLGTILKDAREGKKLTIKDVARETFISPRWIEALENEDFTIFPAETYALGALKSYSEFLNLETGHLENLFRGQQIDLTQSPIEELTRPTGIRLPAVGKNVVFIVAGVAVVLGIGLLSMSGVFRFSSGGSTTQGNTAATNCHDREIIPIALPAKGAPPRQEAVSKENAVRFNLESTAIKLCLGEIQPTPEGKPRALFLMRINDETDFSFYAAEGELVALNSDTQALKELTGEVRITPRAIGEASARIQLESGDKVAVQQQGAIQVTLQFVADSYVEWTDDGNYHRGVEIRTGESRTFEAKNRLEIKVGNGAGVQVLAPGKPPRIAGPPGKIVKITYRKVPDPLDPGLAQIEEKIEAAQ
ncbi:MAG: DUF4115 domain-containing protein [Spirochaetia bacterium]|nr:DUF4115 domain-containing protein [Spirochaetia bacterium]